MMLRLIPFFAALFAPLLASGRLNAYQKKEVNYGIEFDITSKNLPKGVRKGYMEHQAAYGISFSADYPWKFAKVLYKEEVLLEAPEDKQILGLVSFGFEEHSLILVVLEGKLLAFSAYDDKVEKVKIKHYLSCNTFSISSHMVMNAQKVREEIGIAVDFSHLATQNKWYLSYRKGRYDLINDGRIRGADEQGWTYIDNDSSDGSDIEEGEYLSVCPYTSLEDYAGDISDVAFIAFQSYGGYQDSDDEGDQDDAFYEEFFKTYGRDDDDYVWPVEKIRLVEQNSIEKIYQVQDEIRVNSDEEGWGMHIPLEPDNKRRVFRFNVVVIPSEKAQYLKVQFSLISPEAYYKTNISQRCMENEEVKDEKVPDEIELDYENSFDIDKWLARNEEEQNEDVTNVELGSTRSRSSSNASKDSLDGVPKVTVEHRLSGARSVSSESLHSNIDDDKASVKSAASLKSADSAKSVASVRSPDSVESAGSAKSAGSVKSAASVRSADSVESAASAKSAASVRSADSVESAGSAKSVASVRSADSVESAGSAKSAASVRSADSVESAGSAKSVASVRSADADVLHDTHLDEADMQHFINRNGADDDDHLDGVSLASSNTEDKASVLSAGSARISMGSNSLSGGIDELDFPAIDVSDDDDDN
uniref:Surface-erythrocyte phosphoprotein n=2 Tax=Babesia rossi TaxID=167444 RepID=Q95R20_BABRS|nr:surface-erythrocyte phosphoprotein [Babesia canis rossi]